MKNKNASGRSTPNTPKFILSLQHIFERDHLGLNQLEAFNAYGETCLHSTISTLSNNYGIRFKRKLEPHKHRNGGTTHFMRYWISDDDKALRLISCYSGGDL